MRTGFRKRVSKFGPVLIESFTMLASAVLGGAFAVQGAAHSESIAPTKLAAATSAASTSCPDVDVVFARGTLELPGLGIVGTPFTQSVASDLPGLTVTDYADPFRSVPPVTRYAGTAPTASRTSRMSRTAIRAWAPSSPSPRCSPPPVPRTAGRSARG
jgi:hypothetical protein